MSPLFESCTQGINCAPRFHWWLGFGENSKHAKQRDQVLCSIWDPVREAICTLVLKWSSPKRGGMGIHRSMPDCPLNSFVKDLAWVLSSPFSFHTNNRYHDFSRPWKIDQWPCNSLFPVYEDWIECSTQNSHLKNRQDYSKGRQILFKQCSWYNLLLLYPLCSYAANVNN